MNASDQFEYSLLDKNNRMSATIFVTFLVFVLKHDKSISRFKTSYFGSPSKVETKGKGSLA